MFGTAQHIAQINKHCTIYTCTFNYSVTCQFLFALSGIEGFVNKHAWKWQRAIYILLSFAEIEHCCLEFQRKRSLVFIELCIIPFLCQSYKLNTFYCRHVWATAFKAVNISICPFFPRLNILASFDKGSEESIYVLGVKYTAPISFGYNQVSCGIWTGNVAALGSGFTLHHNDFLSKMPKLGAEVTLNSPCNQCQETNVSRMWFRSQLLITESA